MALVRVTISSLFYGQTCQNVIHFNVDAFVASDLQGVADDVDAHWVDEVKVPLAQDVNFYQIKCDEVKAGGGGATYTKNIVKAGGDGFDTGCPLNLAWVLRFETGLSGRRNRGRHFLPGLRPGYTTSGLVNATGLAKWPTRITNLNNWYCTPGSGSNYSLVIAGPGDTGGTARVVSSIVIRSTPGSMRRRMLGVGS